jgi:hypothetical protein
MSAYKTKEKYNQYCLMIDLTPPLMPAKHLTAIMKKTSPIILGLQYSQKYKKINKSITR